ncbi:hypothetical protein VKT23_018249 [Stygiomarasmius scandens]|uniref:Uncharacterized protein n=1 Tax=Marasmiellus scandens TaxID=2682957 RepID=A0ABR1IPU5_9AGAR
MSAPTIVPPTMSMASGLRASPPQSALSLLPASFPFLASTLCNASLSFALPFLRNGPRGVEEDSRRGGRDYGAAGIATSTTTSGDVAGERDMMCPRTGQAAGTICAVGHG